MKPVLSDEELRREADFRRLKHRHPVCVVCRYDRHPAALEYGHISPRKFGVGDGGAICRNCHRELSDQERDLPYQPEAHDRQLEQAGRYILALGFWLECIGRTLKRFGAMLLARAEQSSPKKGTKK